MMARRMGCGVVLLAVAISSSGCNRSPRRSGDQAQRVSTRLPIPIVEAGQTTFYAAADQGFYADEGLNPVFEMGSRELNPVKTVSLGQDDFGVLGGPDALITARSRGEQLKAIAVIHRNSDFTVLLTLRSSGITRVQQLEAAQVGFFYGHISTDVLRALFRKEGVSVTEVDVGFDYNQLITGRISAEWAFRVTAGLDLPAQGIEVNEISPADYGIRTHGYTIFATDESIQSRHDLVLRYLRASLKGVKYTVENPEAALQSLLNRDHELERALNLRRLQMYNAVTSNSDEYPAGYIDHEMFQETYDRLAEVGVIEQPFDVHDAYTTEFLEEIYRRPFDSPIADSSTPDASGHP